MSFSYFHQKLSEAVSEMSTSSQNLKDRLRSSVLKHTFTAFPLEIAPEEVREQFSEIKGALAGRLRRQGSLENYPDAIDRMKPSEVRGLLNSIFSLYECVTRERHRRMFQNADGRMRDPSKMKDVQQATWKLLRGQAKIRQLRGKVRWSGDLEKSRQGRNTDQ